MGKVNATSLIKVYTNEQIEKLMDTNNTANNKVPKEKYLTIVLRYKEVPNDTLKSYAVAKFMSKIMSAISSYNSNSRNGYDPYFDFYGAYIDPDDMDVDEQNDLNENAKYSLNKTK